MMGSLAAGLATFPHSERSYFNDATKLTGVSQSLLLEDWNVKSAVISSENEWDMVADDENEWVLLSPP